MRKIQLLWIFILCYSFSKADFNASLSSNSQYYLKSLGEDDLFRKDFASNNFLDVNYRYSNFNIGTTVESYLPISILSFSNNLEGTNVTNYFLNYSSENLSVELGNFYSQIGNGLIFRTYRDRDLGVDNPLVGASIRYKLSEKLDISGFYGLQRTYFRLVNADITGGEMAFNQSFNDASLKVTGGLVARREPRIDINKPEDELTLAYSGGLDFTYGGFALNAEYAFKGADYNAKNINNRTGKALQLNLSYAQKGFGINAQFRALNNFDFISNRYENGDGTQQPEEPAIGYRLNFLPSFAKIHGYGIYNIYIYQANPNDDIGLALSNFYKVPKKSLLGGKYGMKVGVDYSVFFNQGKAKSVFEENKSTATLTSPDVLYSEFLSFEDKRFQEITLSLEKKFSRDLKLKAQYTYQEFNYFLINEEIKIEGPDNPTTKSNIFVLDGLYKFDRVNSLKFELGYMTSVDGIELEPNPAKKIEDLESQDNWISALLEYTTSWGLSVYVSDLYNFDVGKEHFFTVGSAFAFGQNTVNLYYGKTREGFICVGGVCRLVPETEALNLVLNLKL